MNKERLLAIASYLRNNDLPDFNYGDVSKCVYSLFDKIFPEDFERKGSFNRPISDKCKGFADFLGIQPVDLFQLFVPNYSKSKDSGFKKHIPADSTKEQVAAHIENFVSQSPTGLPDSNSFLGDSHG